MGLGLLILQWKLQDCKKVKLFLKLNCELLEKKQFLDERKFKLFRTHRKRKFSFWNSATYFFEAWFSCTQIYANMYRGLEVLNVIFGFLLQKIMPEPICKVLASLEVILCTKNFIF